MKNILKLSLFTIFIFALSTFAAPAKAFYLEIPKPLLNLVNTLKTSQTSAQSADTVVSQPVAQPTEPAPSQDQGGYQGIGPTPGQDMGYQGIGPLPGQPDQGQNNNGTQGNPGPGPNQGDMQGGQGGPQFGGQGQGGQGGPQFGGQGQGGQGGPQFGGQGQGGQGMGQEGQNEEQQKKQQERQLKDMKRGLRGPESNLKNFESMIAKAEKKGTVVPAEIKDTLEKLKTMISTIKSASSADELQDVDMGGMQDMMQTLDQYRQDVMEKQQRLDGMKRGMKGMESGLKMFKNQIAKLTKQKIVVPTELTDNIAKLETIIASVKAAKTSEEIDAIDFDSLQGLMQNLDENRQQLEILARWPQTLKQMNQEITKLDRKLKSDKTIVDRLLKKEIDLQGIYTSFQEAVAKLKAVRDDAVSKIAAGNSQEAFDAVENDFFGQMEDVWQSDKVIMMMSNLGRFSSDFKQSINQSQSIIKSLNKKKIDTSELQSILDQAKVKGQEVLDMIKSKNLDEDSVSSAMDELENLRQEFGDKVSELTGQEMTMPWEQGPQQFKQVQMSPDVQRFMPQKQESQMPQVAPAPMGPSGF